MEVQWGPHLFHHLHPGAAVTAAAAAVAVVVAVAVGVVVVAEVSAAETAE